MSNKIAANRRGQGLLETIVAFSLLITGIVTLMTLVISASIGRMANEKQTVAVNLAREGIEAVISSRNDNWINNLPFDAGYDYGTDYTYAPLLNAWDVEWALCPDLETINDAEAKVFRFNDSGSFPGLMYQVVGGTPDPNSEDSGYRRMLTLDRICYDGATETVVASGTECVSTPGKIGVRVTALVQWTEKNGIHTVSAVENIYDWR